jgi:outer membrane protein assembly factor BamE (lipoprotein component of BamABCDE complex)
MKKHFYSAIFSFAILTFTACTPMTSQHGNLLEDFQVQEITEGQSSRSDVLRTLGSPTTQSTFNNDVWYYIGQETEKHGILDHEVVNERIITVTFNDEGIVESIDDTSPEREDIPYARSKTPTHGNDLTFMQQLLGNMGRFNTPQQ